MSIAVCSGSFDPVTSGHVDIFERASRMFDTLIVGVFQNINKQYFFSVDERTALLQEATKHIGNLQVTSFDGLLPDYMHSVGASVVIRGLRSVTDFEYERNEAQLIKRIAPDIETVFLLSRPELSYVSSSGVKELARFHGEITGLVPACVETAVRKRQTELENCFIHAVKSI